MPTPYEVLIRNGVAAHIILNHGEDPAPVNSSDWPEIGNAINAASLQRIKELESSNAELQAKLDAIPNEEKLARQRAEALAQAEALEQQAAELRSKLQ